MGYRSYIYAEIVPTRGNYHKLLIHLRDAGFKPDTDQSLLDKQGYATGLILEGEEIRGCEEETKAYGFGEPLIEAFRTAIEKGLIETLRVSRDGEDSEDYESYELIDGKLHEWVEFGVYAPIEMVEEVRERFTKVKEMLLCQK